jgi:hypothetical protein
VGQQFGALLQFVAVAASGLASSCASITPVALSGA